MIDRGIWDPRRKSRGWKDWEEAGKDLQEFGECSALIYDSGVAGLAC